MSFILKYLGIEKDKTKCVHKFLDLGANTSEYFRKNMAEIESVKDNIENYNSLGFLTYNYLDSFLQECVRYNTQPPNSKYSSLLHLFEDLAHIIKDKDAINKLDKLTLKFIYENSNLLRFIDLNGIQMIKDLNEKFSNYQSSFTIQKYLLFHDDKYIDTKYKTVLNRCRNGLKIDLFHYCQDLKTIPNGFFNDHVLNKIFGEELHIENYDRLR